MSYLANSKTSVEPERHWPVLLLLLLVSLLLTFHPGLVECERFIEQPQDAVVSRGQNHVLHCTVEDRIGEVQWLRDGFGLGPGDEFEGFPRYRIQRNEQRGEYNLVISDIADEDNALFECQVGATEQSSGLASRKAKLTVQVPPDAVVIGDGGVTSEVVADRRQALTCRAVGGKPAPTITWQSPGAQAVDLGTTVEVEHVTPGLDGSGGAVSRLMLTPSRQDDGREFVCSAINAAMTEAMVVSTRLHVLYKPEMEITTYDGPLQEHDSFQLTCTADASPHQVTWRWLMNGSEIPGERSDTLQLDSVSYQMNGRRLMCEATNSVGTTRLDYTLQVEYGPRFIHEPQSQAADVGDDVTLTCEVEGNPTPTVYWRRRGDERVLGRQHTLRLSRVTSDQFGTYTCSASSVGRSTVSRDVHLLRNGAPIIVSSRQQWARKEETANIECLVKAIPPPKTVTWTKNGQPIDFRRMPRYEVREKMLPDGLLSVLRIYAVEDLDFAVYNCSANNAYDSAHLPIRFSQTEEVPLIYILIGIGAGLFLIIIIVVIIISIVVICHRRKSAVKSESDSRSSEDSVDLKKSNRVTPDIKIEYSKTNAVNDWQTDLLVPHHYGSPHPPRSDYAQLPYPRKEPVNHFLTYDGGHYGPYDTYRQRPHSTLPTVSDNPYGTFPRGISYTPQPTGADGIYGPVYGSDIYATVGRPRGRPYWPASAAAPALQVHSVSPTDSRLSTNV